MDRDVTVHHSVDHDPNNRVKVSLLPLIYVETETAVSTTGGTLSSGISVNKAGHDMALGIGRRHRCVRIGTCISMMMVMIRVDGACVWTVIGLYLSTII